jgi:hypothetical protein
MIQSILFDRHIWSLDEAYDWLKKHNFKMSFYGKSVDIKPNHYRFRQSEPDPNHNYITKNLGDGIELIIMTNMKGKGIPKNKIPYEEALKLSNETIRFFATKGIKLIPVGSVARHSKLVGDLDFVTMDNLGGRKYIKDKITHKGHEVSIDIWTTPNKSNFALFRDLRLYPRYYSIALRSALKRKGYKLTDQEIIDQNGNKLKYTNMKDLAQLAGIKYHPLTHYYGGCLECGGMCGGCAECGGNCGGCACCN